MENNLGDYRKSYEKGVLLESHLTKSPIELFEKWFEKAKEHEINDPNALALGTSDHENQPNVRMVLLKGLSSKGFVFISASA